MTHRSLVIHGSFTRFVELNKPIRLHGLLITFVAAAILAAPNFDWDLYNLHRSNQVDSSEELSVDFEEQQEERLPVAP